MSSWDSPPDYPLSSDLVRRLKSALATEDEDTVQELICTEVEPVDAVIELANDDWMKEPSAKLPTGVLLGNHKEATGQLLMHAGVCPGDRGKGSNRVMISLVSISYIAMC